MRTIKPFLIVGLCTLLLAQCKKNLVNAPVSSPVAQASLSAAADATFETVINGSFADYASLEANWNYLYPWGSDHNGSARMYASTTDHNHVYLESGGVLRIRASRITWNEGNSTSDPHLAIKYHSGAIHAKHHVLINDQFPNYEIRGDFQVPTVTGSWPAFWLTAVNSWPPESDIMEFKGNSNNWQNTFRTSTDVSSIITNVSSAGSWHNYKVWISKVNATDVQIHYYIDNVWKGAHTANFVGKPLYIIINMQMEGSSGAPGPNGDTYVAARNLYVGRSRAY